MHRLSTAYLPFRCSNSRAVVKARRAADAPSGWPTAMAPPFGFTRGSRNAMFIILRHPGTWTENASLISMMSMLASVRPARSSALGMANACARRTASRDSASDRPTGGRRGSRTAWCGPAAPCGSSPDHQRLFAPVELEGFAKLERQWHKRRLGRLASLGPPAPDKHGHPGVAAGETQRLQLSEQHPRRASIPSGTSSIGVEPRTQPCLVWGQ